MRLPTTRDSVIQILLAGFCLAPLIWSFTVGRSDGALITFSEVVESFLRSGLAALLAVAMGLAIGLPVGWALSGRRRSPWLLALCALPLALPPSVAVSGWLRLVAPDGPVSSFTMATDGLFSPGPFFSVPGVGFVLGLGLWPIIAFEAWPGFRRARGEGYAAALLCGSRWRAFCRIALPSAWGEVTSGALLVFLLAASDFTVSSLLLVKTLPVTINDQLESGQTAVAAWMSLPMLVLVTVVALLLSRRRQVSTEQETREMVGARPWLGRVVVSLGLLAGFVVPLGGCALGALDFRGSLWPSVTEGWPYLAVSLRLAGGVTLLSLLLGAVRVVVWPEMRATPLRWAGLLLLALPGSFVASGFLTMQFAVQGWGFPWFSTGSLVLSLGYFLRFIYLPLRLAEEGLSGLEPSMLETAEMAGHGRFSRGLTVALPLVWSHLLAAGALVFVFVLGELPLSQRLAPPGQTPVCLWLFNLQHYNYTESVFMLCLMLGATVVVGLLIVAAFSSWRKGEARAA